MPEKDPDLGTANDALLKRIRQRYRYAMDKWRRNREEGQKNMRYVAGDPWTEEDKQARKGRPTVCPDELNQYVNQVVNTARQNPRGIKVDPAGNQATEELAEYRENRIRAIEYACNASQVYVSGLQGAVERNVGYWRVTRAYIADDTDEQEILILPIQNPDLVLLDPDYKELDGSDIKYAFELDKMPLDEFEHEYPEAEKRSFTAEDFGDDASYWYDGKSILLASYWEVKTSYKKVGKAERQVQSRTVQQYVTNGVEILRKGSVQPGPYIPIIPVFGKELWVDYGEGGGNAERVLISLVSLARDPQKALAYVMSSMLENCGQIPKSSFIGSVGQFETDKEAWDTLNSVYHPYLQYDLIADSGNNPLPPPQRTPLTPDFQAYSVGADICRRAIQAAMGISPLPTAAQRQNQKSGTALSKIQSEQAIGSYHLVDSYDRAIKLTGRIVNHWLSEIDLGETERPVRLADGKHKLVKINTDASVTDPSSDHEYHFPIADDKGRYQVTISAGPSHESQREEGSEFVDTLLQNLKDLPPPGTPAAKILAIGIRIKQLGPLGDQMADIIDPPNSGQGQQLAQMQQQSRQMQMQMQEMQATLQKLMLERQGKVIEMQGKAQQQALQHQFDMSEADKDREVKLAVAEIGTKAQIQTEREGMVNDLESQFHQQAHEVALQSVQQDHAQQMQEQGAQQQQEAQVQQAALQPQAEPSAQQ
jgi:hypothetical protein